jgi:ApaG protein
MSGAYEAETRGVRVKVEPVYLPEQSDPRAGQYAWAYTVDIENNGTETVQLLSRHWIITDAVNRVEEVAGPGVIGEQPVLRPGDAFHYTSACPLKTPSGAMHGTYRMETEGGELFDAIIPPFSLHLPDATRSVN